MKRIRVHSARVVKGIGPAFVLIPLIALFAFSCSPGGGDPPPPVYDPAPTYDYNFYYGTFHNHTEYSDGKGVDPAFAFAYARDTAKLDWLGMTDHGESMRGTKWADTLTQADAATQDGVFVAMRGFEWTSTAYGHVCVLGSDDSCSAYSLRTFPELVDWINARDCVATFNHPGRFNSSGTEHLHYWSAPSDKFIAVELFGDNGFFDEYYYNDGYYAGDGGKGYLDEALSRGWRVGAGGGFDEHEGTWGTAKDYRLGVMAKSLTRADLMAALKARRFFSTSDKNLRMSFAVGADEMGSSVPAGALTAEIKASDPDGDAFTRVELIKNGAVAKAWAINEATPELSYSFTASGGDYYYCRVKEADGGEGISSPIWITGAKADAEAPSVPTGLSAPTITSSSVSLAWTASTDNVGVAGYKIYRDGTQIGESVTASYTDNNLAENTTYSYTVAAYDAALNVSAASDAAGATTTIEAPGKLAGSTTDTGSDHCGLDISMSRYQAAADGSAAVVRIKLDSAAGGNVKCAVYSDASGAPGVPLGSTVTLATPAAGWQEFALSSPVSIVKDSYYWIIAWSDNSNFNLRCASETGNGRYKRITYGDWPNPMDADVKTNNVRYCMYAQ